MAIMGGGGIGGGPTTNVQINVQANIDQSQRQFTQLNQTINNFSRQAQQSAGRASQAMDGFGLHMRRVNANVVLAGFALVGLGHKVSDFIERGAKMELFAKRMEGVSGSIRQAEKDMSAVITMAQNVPFKLEAVTRSFIKMKSAGLEPIVDAQGNGPLKSLIDAMAAFGGDSEQLDRATIALTQMAGKGTVSMEELRQQLGEAIPTAMRIAAREMNLTVAQFIKDVSKGKITWEEFAEVFFKGLDKNYAGAAARLMNTFTGATSQLDTQLDILAKTIFVDTGTMRYFTAAVQMATEKLKEFDAFLRTPEGQKWIDDAWVGFQQLARYAADAVSPVEDVVKAIGSFAEIVSGATDALPAEIVGGGLIGFALFGRAGIIPGAIIGAFSDELAAGAKKVAEFAAQVEQQFGKFGGAANAAAVGGMLGFMIAGPKGALVGAVVGGLSQLTTEITGWMQSTEIGFLFFKESLSRIMSGDFSSTSYDIVKAIGPQIEEIKQRYSEVVIDVPVKIDLPETGSVNTFGEDVSAKLDQITQKATAAKEQLRQTLSEFSSATVDAASKISDVKIGDFTKEFLNKEDAIQQLTDYRTTMEAEVTKLQDHLTDLYNRKGKITALGLPSPFHDREIAQHEATLKEAVRLRNDTADQLSNIKLMPEGGLAGEGQAMLQEMQQFVSTIDTSFQSVEQLQQGLQQFTDMETQFREAVENSNLTLEQKSELLRAADQMHRELAGGMELVNEKAASANAPMEENKLKVQELANGITDLNNRANKLMLGDKMNEEAGRMAEATGKVDALLGDIQQKILQVQQAADKGLISQQTADASIANLQRIAAAVEGSRGQIINAASDMGQAWTQMGSQIYSAIESSLGDAIYNLVTGAKSMKDVLLDLWRSVTRAVANYVAKLIMASLFGGLGGGGGMMGGLFGSNTGSQLSFAGGGMVDGRTGFDKNVVGMRVSRGERITVETAAQQRANHRGLNGRGDTFIIQAWDGVDVERVLFRHSGAVNAAVKNEMRLNRK